MITLIAAVIAATVATLGYMITARAKLLEDRRTIYAAALSKVLDYQELPHRIRRRADSGAATRGQLGAFITDLQRDMDHYHMLLSIDSEKMGDAYLALMRRSQGSCAEYRKEAWEAPPATTDKEMSYLEPYSFDDDEERKRCLKVMREQLVLLPWKQAVRRVWRRIVDIRDGMKARWKVWRAWGKVTRGRDGGDEVLRKKGLSELTEALQIWSFQNASKIERWSWLRRLQRLSQLGDNYRQEAEAVREFANTNARWDPIDPLV
jgi:hypothetical protein